MLEGVAGFNHSDNRTRFSKKIWLQTYRQRETSEKELGRLFWDGGLRQGMTGQERIFSTIGAPAKKHGRELAREMLGEYGKQCCH